MLIISTVRGLLWMYLQIINIKRSYYENRIGPDEILLISEVDLSAASEKREKKPYTSIRRPDLYE